MLPLPLPLTMALHAAGSRCAVVLVDCCVVASDILPLYRRV
jgi:hypothetical protein